MVPADDRHWPVQVFGGGDMTPKRFEGSLWHATLGYDGDRMGRVSVLSAGAAEDPEDAHNRTAWRTGRLRTTARHGMPCGTARAVEGSVPQAWTSCPPRPAGMCGCTPFWALPRSGDRDGPSTSTPPSIG